MHAIQLSPRTKSVVEVTASALAGIAIGLLLWAVVVVIVHNFF